MTKMTRVEKAARRRETVIAKLAAYSDGVAKLTIALTDTDINKLDKAVDEFQQARRELYTYLQLGEPS